MNIRTLKLVLIASVLLGSTLALLAWTRVWVDAEVAQAGSGLVHLDVTGSTAAPALTALALAGLALAGALTIAGPVIRIVLGLLEVLLGISVFLSALPALQDPAAASAAAVTAATGIAGRESVHAGIVDPVVTGWPFAAIIAAVIMALAGFGILATAKRWPGPTRRYQSARFEPATSAETQEAGTGAAVDDWDDLSRGDDPTA